MARDPHIPDAFDVYTVVVLRRPADALEMSDEELDVLQARHLAYRADLVQQGLVVVNGPFDEQTDVVSRLLVVLPLGPVPGQAFGPGARPPLRQAAASGRRIWSSTYAGRAT